MGSVFLIELAHAGTEYPRRCHKVFRTLGATENQCSPIQGSVRFRMNANNQQNHEKPARANQSDVGGRGTRP